MSDCSRKTVEMPVQVKACGSPAPADQTIAANLLRCKDPATDAPLTDAQLLPMAAMFFWAGGRPLAICILPLE